VAVAGAAGEGVQLLTECRCLRAGHGLFGSMNCGSRGVIVGSAISVASICARSDPYRGIGVGAEGDAFIIATSH
jgi:hypothetical protein